MRIAVVLSVALLVLGCGAPESDERRDPRPGQLMTLERPPSAPEPRPAPPVRMLTGDAPAPAVDEEPRLVTAQIVSERGGWRPGTTQDVGVHLVVAPGWHLSWNGADTVGAPLQVRVQPAPGFTVDEVRWPAPERLQWPDGRVDHVHRGALTLLLSVSVPAELDDAGFPSVRVFVRWQAQHADRTAEPSGASLTLSLPILGPGVTETPPPAGALFEAARARVPPPVPERIPSSWDGSVARFRAPDGAALAFVPALDCTPLVGEPTVSGGELVLRRDVDQPSHGRLLGLLEVTEAAATHPTYYRVDLAAR